jgi:hypothetical protein
VIAEVADDRLQKIFMEVHQNLYATYIGCPLRTRLHPRRWPVALQRVLGAVKRGKVEHWSLCASQRTAVALRKSEIPDTGFSFQDVAGVPTMPSS